MNEYFRRKMGDLFRGFGKPDFDLGSDKKIDEADDTIRDLFKSKKELEARLKLLAIRSMPHGDLRG